MASNILINFSADTGGLDEANRKLEELKKREQELIVEIEKLRREQTALNLSTNDGNKRIQIEREYAKRIQETRNQLRQTRRDLDNVTEAQRNLEQTISRGASLETFRALRRELTEQLRQLQLNGEAGSEAYDKIRQRLTELNVAQQEVNAQIQQQSSATFALDTIIKGTQLAAGGYSVLAGTMGLFGQKSQEVQATMLKLQSIIAVTTGLHSVYNTVVGKGNIITRISVIQTRAKAIAESLATKNTIAATVAQKAFNLVAMANPYVLLAVAIISVVGALYIFSRNTETAAEKQKRLNDLQREALDIKDRYADALKTQGDQRIRELERELELMEAQGKSEAQLALKRRQINAERERNALTLYNTYSQEANSIEENTKKAKQYRDALRDLNLQMQQNNWKGNTKIKFRIDDHIIKDEADKIKDIIQGKLDLVTLNISKGLEANNAVDEARHKAQVDAENDRKKALEAGKRNAVAMAEYNVLIAKKGSQEELNAQIAALEAKRNADLQNANITKGERLRIVKETEIQIQKLRNDYAKFILEDEKAMIEAGLQLSVEGTLERYSLQSELLEKQEQIELNQLNLTENKKALIRNKYRKQRLELDREFDKTVAENTLNTNIATINAALAQVKEGSADAYSLQIEMLQERAKAEKAEVENTIKNEELKAARIKEINAQLARDIRDTLTDQRVNEAKRQADAEILIVSQQYSQGLISKRRYEDELNRITIDSLNKQIAERRKNGDDTVDLEQELADKRIAIAEDEAEARKAIQEELYNTISSISSSYFTIQKNRIQQQLDDLKNLYTTDAEKAKENSELKLLSEEEYNREQLKLKQKQAEAEKKEAIFNLTLTSYQAISRAYKDFKWPFNIVIAGLMGAATLAQLNAAKSQPVPKYWKGRKGGQGEFALVGEHGAELMYVPKGASIMPAHDSLRALNGDMSVMSKWKMPAINPNYPVVPNISKQLVNDAKKQQAVEIDYDKIGRSVAKYQKKQEPAKVSVSFDKSGLSVTNGNTTTKYSNSRGNV